MVQLDFQIVDKLYKAVADIETKDKHETLLGISVSLYNGNGLMSYQDHAKLYKGATSPHHRV